MSYIGRTNGGNTVIEIREGVLSDIPEDDRANWRNAEQVKPNPNNWTVTRASAPTLTVNGDGSQINIIWNNMPIDAAWGKMRLKDYAANVRWNKQQGGITLLNGMKIKTDDASQAKIHQAFSVLKEGWVESIDFKTSMGFVTIDFATITLIAQAVAAHIQHCFTAEKAILAAIDADEVTLGTEIDEWAWTA